MGKLSTARGVSLIQGHAHELARLGQGALLGSRAPYRIRVQRQSRMQRADATQDTCGILSHCRE